jgi:hypothetical protein
MMDVVVQNASVQRTRVRDRGVIDPSSKMCRIRAGSPRPGIAMPVTFNRLPWRLSACAICIR